MQETEKELVLEETGAIRILVALLEDEMTYTVLKDKVKISDSALSRILRLLKENGLIEEEKEKVFPFKRILRLSEKGKKIAVHLERALKEFYQA